MGDSMKKNIFIILVSTLFILMLIYFYDQKELVLNKEYIDAKRNIYVEYPYFNHSEIDRYINGYLNQYIEDYQLLENFLFIDYDYEEINENIDLKMYIYGELGNLVKREVREVEIDLNQGIILSSEEVCQASLEYDGYVQKIIDKNKPMVALTFDDGPNHNTIRILDILEHYGVKATFFILGTNITEKEEIIEKMNDLGMEIGNHMYSHKLITKLSDEKILSEVERVDTMIFDIIGRYPTLIRPSYGTFNKRIKSLLDRPIIIWNVDTLDWKYHNSNRIYNKIMKNVSDGDIILMHDIYSATANSLEKVIPELLESGYQLVTVSELLYYKGVEMKEGEVYSHAH